MSLDSPQDSQPSHAHAHKVCKTSSVVESGHLDAASKIHRPHTGDLLFPRGAALVLFLFASNNHTPVSLYSLPYLCEYNTYQTTKLTLFSLFCYISVTEPNIPFSLKKKKNWQALTIPEGCLTSLTAGISTVNILEILPNIWIRKYSDCWK